VRAQVVSCGVTPCCSSQTDDETLAITDTRKKISCEEGKSNYVLNAVNSYQNTRWQIAMH